MSLGTMRIFSIVTLLLHALVMSTSVSGAAVDRHEGDRRNTAVINLLATTQDKKFEEESMSVGTTTVDYNQEEEEEDYEDEEEYYDEQYEDGLSGDYEMPRVSMSSKPKDPSVILEAERTEGPRKRGKGRKKGKGRKRNPCLKKYKDFCIHGTCQYLRDIRAPSCVCHQWYSGDRCQFFTLPVEKPQEGYNRTTALAVIAVVLSSVCLTIIGLLLMLRFHKRGAYDVESEEKVKLGLPSNH